MWNSHLNYKTVKSAYKEPTYKEIPFNKELVFIPQSLARN